MAFPQLTFRRGAALAALICALLLAYAYYLQYVKGLEPCPLCLVQRLFFYGVLIVFALGALHGRMAVLYGGLAILFALGGAAAASRQVWLQSLPPDQVPQCGPDLYYMLQNFPLSRTLEKLIKGTGECAVVDWSFLGLSIAGWSLVWFVILAGYAAWLALRSRTASAASR
jgi:disulfide bond formation protein DsbB